MVYVTINEEGLLKELETNSSIGWLDRSNPTAFDPDIYTFLFLGSFLTCGSYDYTITRKDAVMVSRPEFVRKCAEAHPTGVKKPQSGIE